MGLLDQWLGLRPHFVAATSPILWSPFTHTTTLILATEVKAFHFFPLVLYICWCTNYVPVTLKELIAKLETDKLRGILI